MERQKVIDALIGLMLLVIFVIVVGVPFAAIGFALDGVFVVLRHYFPTTSSDLWFYGLMSLAIFGGAVRQLRKHHWTNAFLSLAAFTTIFLLGILRLSHRFIGVHDPTFLVGSIACVLFVPGPVRFGARTRFFWAAATISLSFALGSGLLGFGSFSGFVSFSLIVGMLAWIVFAVRDNSARWDTLFSPASK